MQAILDPIIAISNWFWGWPILILLVGGGVFLTFRLGFYQFRYFGHIIKNTFGTMFKKYDGDGVSPFAAAATALASSIGASNIVGVPVAIALGGPGAVFWMWITAFVGMATKFTEICLGIKYREKNEKGEWVGGPMYYLKATGFPILSTIFAFMLMVEIAPSISTQTLTYLQNAELLGINKYLAVGIFILIVGVVVFGGLSSISKFAEKMVPFMAIAYILGAFIVIFANINGLIPALISIFKNAFTPTAAIGGFGGAAVMAGIRNGLARGAYSNEAGMGTSPIGHASSNVDIPAEQGIWAVFEIFVDTIVVCTVTALVVLTSGIWTEVGSDQAATMPAMAFQNVLGGIGGPLVALCLMLFVITTVIVIIFFGEKQAEFLFGSTVAKIVRVIYMLFIVVVLFLDLTTLYSLLDFMLALVIIPNMIGVLLLSGEAVKLKDQYFKDPKYYPGAKKDK